ncbi:hypothetical protein SAMD00019534_078650 [Acytostelium subglobosum LB1]|uniref:hypothetical protein n=1 Tax=Acytostelium subglobosum LB1 TaxID=1410327 RepID=UPI000644851A|nr:hypothetical protein SAMD00019534_078650 [Acytostelium subglobosum LB1]GAM24690.1 hypothetical protein SAMD00019534_078650 [Acytostelium subglobosum LB1]|eukprot:XP_012752359.1 hypothetical protein SAMD00019534_078650 [Acytostelium subglobosum LB1]
MREEQSHKKILDDELDKTTTSINNIINEIANINAHTTQNNSVNDINHNDDEDGEGVDIMSQLVRSIQTSKTMDQFIDKQFKTCDDDVTIGDDQLLDFVRRGSQATQTVHTVTEPIRIEFDSYLLERDFRELINYEDTPTRIEHGFRNHIFSLSDDSCSMLSLDTNEWTVIDDKCTPREYIFRSVVYARDSVYVFGGKGSPSTYSRFSLIDQKWHNDIEIIGVDGGESISTCYDGDNLIYLVGGFHNDKMLHRIDCFNIDTQQFSSVGRMSVPTRASHSFFRINRIVIVGGYVDAEYKVSLTDILKFNIDTKECDVFLKTEFHPDEYITSCYDDIDHVFIMGDKSTLLVNLSIKNSTQSIEMHTSGCPCLYTQSHGFVTLGGTGDNERFSLLHNKWISLDDNDPVEDRSSFGTCHIHH